eukprot:597413-Rhodomonas_salina.2
MSYSLVLTVNEEEPDLKMQAYFRAAVGSLMYMVSWSRQDLAQAVGYLVRFLSRPTDQAVKVVHRVFAYLRSTPHHSIKFNVAGSCKCTKGNQLYAYTDSSDADCPTSRRSTGGYLARSVGTASKHQSLKFALRHHCARLLTLTFCFPSVLMAFHHLLLTLLAPFRKSFGARMLSKLSLVTVHHRTISSQDTMAQASLSKQVTREARELCTA